MQLTPGARKRLRRLLDAVGPVARGFRVRGILGTCAGSTPLLKPAAGPNAKEVEIEADGICFFVPPRYIPMLVHLSRAHGFFQGWGSRFRMEPADAVALWRLCGSGRAG